MSDLSDTELEMAVYQEMMTQPSAAPKRRNRPQINHEAQLTRRAEELQLDHIAGFPLSFSDSLVVTCPPQLKSNKEESSDGEGDEDEVDPTDDLKRELAFYQQALFAVQKAQKELADEDMPFFRPSDYFAEMIKTDHHMMKVRFHSYLRCQRCTSSGYQ
jgi:rRNA-processing protein EBP2